MAQRVHIVLEDDIDGSKAEETVTFGLDGVTYEIDLSTANAAKLRDELAAWVGHARRVRGGGNGRRTASARGTGPKEDLNAIREWGRSNGYKVSDRGRVSAEVREAYASAHS